MGIILFIAVLLVAVAQLALGTAGLDYLGGLWLAVAGALAAVVFRFTLPMTVGTYFGVVNVLDWPWWAGVLIALPGILFMIPAVVAALVGAWRERA